MPIPVGVTHETGILGIATDPGDATSQNPKARFHRGQGTYPTRDDMLKEMPAFEKVLIENVVKVFRPMKHRKITQILARDLGFVIANEFFISALNDRRKREGEAIAYLIDLLSQENIIDLHEEKGLLAEGGDIVPTEKNAFRRPRRTYE